MAPKGIWLSTLYSGDSGSCDMGPVHILPAAGIEWSEARIADFNADGRWDGEFEQIAASPSANEEQKLTAQFELGRAWEALGERERARAAYEAVAAGDL